jgi:hypothetical protein
VVECYRSKQIPFLHNCLVADGELVQMRHPVRAGRADDDQMYHFPSSSVYSTPVPNQLLVESAKLQERAYLSR